MKRASIERFGSTIALASLLALLLLAAGPGAGTPGHAKGKGSGPCKLGDLAGYLDTARGGKLKSRRAPCSVAKRVASTFGKKCLNAYMGQTGCRVKARGKWRCRSQMLGPRTGGTPAGVRCKKGKKKKVGFTAVYFPPSDAELVTGDRARLRAVSPAWNEAQRCIDTNAPGVDVPPPSLANFRVRVVGGAPLEKGIRVQEALIATNAWSKIHNGLGAKPRIDPGRLPIIVTSGTFGTALGTVTKSCQDDSWDAVLIRASLTDTEFAWVGVHELFHGFSIGHGAASNTPWQNTWFEEASAAWSQAKVGLENTLVWDNELQFPNVPIDKFGGEGQYHYAMSRFIQFLDSSGYVSSGNAWLLHRRVIAKYPDATNELNNALVQLGTNLGEQVAAFWGDRIRQNPLHGPKLNVGGEGTRQLEIDPLLVEVPMETERLRTKMIEFTAADDVTRIELEFREPQDGHFWVGVEPNRSIPVSDGQSLSFCVGGQGVDELPWPGKLPITFTNGKLQESRLRGTIDVSAQRNAEQCGGGGGQTNRACRTLQDAGVEEMFGAGSYPFASSSTDADLRMWLCFYVGNSGEVQHNLVHHRTATGRQVRRIVKRQINDIGLREINGVGDLAGIGTITDDDGKTTDALIIASGRETIFLLAAPTNAARTKRLGKLIVGQVE